MSLLVLAASDALVTPAIAVHQQACFDRHQRHDGYCLHSHVQLFLFILGKEFGHTGLVRVSFMRHQFEGKDSPFLSIVLKIKDEMRALHFSLCK